MPSLEYCYENADSIADEVLSSWAVYNGEDLSTDFKDLLELACQYDTAKKVTENHRNSLRLIRKRTDEPAPDIDAALEEATAKELAMRTTFAKAVKEYRDKPKAPSN